jgi:hypothetical protein
VRLLQAMDVLSLAICCTTPPETTTQPLHARPGSSAIKLQLHRPTPDVLLVKPWPFATPTVDVDVPYRVVPERAYASDDELRVTYASAPKGSLRVQVRPS